MSLTPLDSKPFPMTAFFLPVLAYFLGSIPVGLVAGKLKGIDIRQHGSGNIGATNAFRVLGKGTGILVFLSDFAKGFVPVLLAISLVQFKGMDQTMVIPALGKFASELDQFSAQLIQVLTGLCAILGHNFPVWLKFKGGKGIATTAGALCALMPVGILVLIIIWAITFGISKYVSLASIVAALSLPLVTIYGSWRHGKLADGTWNKPLFILSIVMALLAVWRHRSNIQRLRAGTENRAFSKKS